MKIQLTTEDQTKRYSLMEDPLQEAFDMASIIKDRPELDDPDKAAPILRLHVGEKLPLDVGLTLRRVQ